MAAEPDKKKHPHTGDSRDPYDRVVEASMIRTSQQQKAIEHLLAATRSIKEKAGPVLAVQKLLNAARCGDEEMVQQALDEGADVNGHDLETGMTAAHYAASVGAGEVIAVLIARDDLNLLIKDRQGRLPGTYAYLAEDEALGAQLVARQVEQAETRGLDYEVLQRS